MCQAVPTLPTGCGAGGSRAEICRDPACSMSSAASFVWGFYFPVCLFVFSLPALILSWLRAGAGGRVLRGGGSHLGMGMRAVGHPKALWGHKRWLLGHRLLLHGVCSPHPTPTTPFNARHFASPQLEPCPAGITGLDGHPSFATRFRDKGPVPRGHRAPSTGISTPVPSQEHRRAAATGHLWAWRGAPQRSPGPAATTARCRGGDQHPVWRRGKGQGRPPAPLSAFLASRSSPALLQQHEALGCDAF